VGPNALDYSAYATTVAVNLLNGTATGTGGVANIQKVTGGTGNDTLTGGNGVHVRVWEQLGRGIRSWIGGSGVTFDWERG